MSEVGTVSPGGGATPEGATPEGATPEGSLAPTRFPSFAGSTKEERRKEEREQLLAALVAKVEKETKPPEACSNCGEHPPVGVVVSPVVGRLGVPRAVWVCSFCRSFLEVEKERREQEEATAAEAEARKRRRKKKPTAGRLGKGLYGAGVMSLAYKFGGFTSRQLGEFLLLEDPRRFAGSRTTPERAAVKSAGESLSLLRRNGLMKSVGIRRVHVFGERRGKDEEFYHLHGEGIRWGAEQNGVMDRTEAHTSYKRHLIPFRAEHSAYRNDIYLQMLRDFQKGREFEEGQGTLAENAHRVVVSGVEDFIGESYADYPHAVARLEVKKASKKNVPRPGRTWETLTPDGRPRVVWADELACSFDVEAERESGISEAANKVDRFCGYWLRLYKIHEDEWREPQIRAVEEQIAELDERREEIEVDLGNIKYEEEVQARHGRGLDEGMKNWRAELEKEKKSEHLSLSRRKHLERQLVLIRKSRPVFWGLPSEVAPVLFIHQTKARSEGARKALRDGEYPMPRYNELRAHLLPVMREWEAAKVYELNAERRAAGMPEAQLPQDTWSTSTLNALFLFTSWEELKQRVDQPFGGTLKPLWREIGAVDIRGGMTLRKAAEHRKDLRPEEVARLVEAMNMGQRQLEEKAQASPQASPAGQDEQGYQDGFLADQPEPHEEVWPPEASEVIEEPPPEPYYPDDDPGNDDGYGNDDEPGRDDGEGGNDIGLIRTRRRR